MDGDQGFKAREMCCVCNGGSTYQPEPTNGLAEGESCSPGQNECAEGLVCRDAQDSTGAYVPMCTTEETDPVNPTYEAGAGEACDYNQAGEYTNCAESLTCAEW